MNRKTWNRRDVLNATVALALAPRLSVSESENMLTRPIPGTDESIPVVGLGTWRQIDDAHFSAQVQSESTSAVRAFTVPLVRG